MCGRARCTLQSNQIRQLVQAVCSSAESSNKQRDIQIAPSAQDVVPSGENLSPGMIFYVAVPISNHGSNIHIESMRWGLIPHSHTKSATKASDYYKMFNARIETVAEKWSFKNLIHRNRAVVVLNGFYEWMGESGSKRPYYIHIVHHSIEGLPIEKPMFLPALYDVSSDGLQTFTVLTCDSSKSISWIHDRQPVFLMDNQVQKWLDVEHVSGTEILTELMGNNYDQICIESYEVSSKMTNAKYDGADCATQLKPKKLIQNYFTSPSSSSSSLPKSLKSSLGDQPAYKINADKSPSNLSDIISIPEESQHNLSEDVMCPFCSKNLTSSHLLERERHVDQCLHSYGDENKRRKIQN